MRLFFPCIISRLLTSIVASMRVHSTTSLLIAIRPGTMRTLTPFLYQTRTLSVGRLRRNFILQLVHSGPAHTRRFLHNSNIPISRVGVSSRHNLQVYKSLVSRNGDAERSERPNADHIPWEESSGGKRMGEEQRSSVTSIDGLAAGHDESFDDLRYPDDPDSFADEDSFNENQEEMDMSLESTSHPSRESTITATEREAFERIFADIMTRSKSVGAYSTSPSFSDNQAVISTVQSTEARKARDPARAIMKSATISVSDTGRKSNTSKFKNKSQEEIRAHVDQYPIPLRAAAAKALGLASGRSIETSDEEIISNADELETTRQPERERVENMMRSAKTDIELWQVMENEVFALIRRLGLQEKPKIQNESTKPRTQRRTRDTSKVAGDKVSAIAKDERPLALNIYGPLYPSHILLGLRLLDRSFTKPSPLVLNLLPRIKSLGIVSQVLGASTSFYNELLRIYWKRYDDFNGVLDLLKEMEQAGLEFDEESLNIINEIHQEQVRVRKGDRVKESALRELWSLPEFAPGKFRSWKEKIQTSIDEKTMENGGEVTWVV